MLHIYLYTHTHTHTHTCQGLLVTLTPPGHQIGGQLDQHGLE